MKRLTLYTTGHRAQLATFAKHVTQHSIARTEFITRCRVGLVWEPAIANHLTKALLNLLHDAAINENPIYKHSQKLKIIAQSLKNTPLYINEAARLKAYLHTNQVLHIDGYVTFRMAAYHEKLDMMLYHIMKKINFGK
ncbi:MAG: hypothetical protein FWG38_05110 [Defluviitaleaceae bacterium]|nr:hypothetical protein [Defluviitaleaceae bacterium]